MKTPQKPLTILTPEWLYRPETRTLVDALEAVRPNCLRFVGGCVRNTLMGREVDDIDVATQLKPEETVAALEQANIRAIPTGIEHGTITAIIDHQPFEVTSLRRDIETDGRRAVVAFTEDWFEDAERRDFRLNALYLEPDGTLHDPIGGGLEDTHTGRIIFIGNADHRLREDYLRILRFFRFNAWYGAAMDAEGLAACERQKTGLARIARERIWTEFKKLLSAPDPVTVIEAMSKTGILEVILPASGGLEPLRALRATEHLVGAEPDALLRLMALIPPTALAVHETAKTLRLSNREAQRLIMWAADNLPETAGMGSKDLRATLYWHGRQAVVDRTMLSGLDVRDVLAAINSWRRPEFPINGDDALAAGLSGPEIGQALSRVARVWVDSDFTLEREKLLKLLVQDKN